ncbi:MAG: type II secretion system protein GspN [Calothrix sp. SM1_5_4]|nr:type II secretion system protein GspN [Calothrix sp. SM1_5_4]
MNLIRAAMGWIWSQMPFFLALGLAALFFFVWSFPFSDLSDVATNAVAKATDNKVYVQFESLDIHLIPQPAVSATNLSVETALPPLQAKWAKVTPSLVSLITELPSLIKAARGDQAAAQAVSSRIGVSISAEEIFGGDIDLSIKPGSKSEGGKERSRVSLAIEKVNLAEVQKWSDLPMKMQGRADVHTNVQLSFNMQEQPEGEYEIRISKFALPASTIMVPMNGANLPVNIPTVTLASVLLRGRLVGGNLIIEEGTFGQNKDPLFGRIKGSLGLRFQTMRSSITPIFGSYNLTVDLNTTAPIEKSWDSPSSR